MKPSEMREKLEQDDRLVERALVVLYERQTATEQALGITKESNGVGFTAFDAEFLTSLAEQVNANKYQRPLGQRLSPKQRECARKKVLKYSGQLAKIAEAKLATQPVSAGPAITVPINPLVAVGVR